MTGLRGALAGVLALAALLAVLGAGIVAREQGPLEAALAALVGLSFVGSGCHAWLRRPHGRLGGLLCAAGIAWLAGALAESEVDVVRAVALVLGPLFLALLAHALLSFPSGRIAATAPRAVVAAAYLAVLVTVVPWIVLGGAGRPELIDAPQRAALALLLADLFGIALAAAVAVLLVRRVHGAPARERAALVPVLVGGAAVTGAVGIDLALRVSGAAADVIDAGRAVAVILLAVLPLAFLAGLARVRGGADAVSALLERLQRPVGADEVRDALAAALGDPGLELVVARERGGWVTPDGRPVELPRGGRRVATEVHRDGRAVGAIVHDAELRDDPELLRAAAASAGLALENERLAAQLRARVAELQASRRRVLEVATTERRRLERDLHDGAQQRLVALALQLGLARRRLEGGDDGGAAALLDGARQELAQALEELRELARGIHPAILTDRGLGPALEALAGRAALPVEVQRMPDERLPAPVEAAAYFVVAEAVTNAAKHAGASRALVSVDREDGWAVVEVRDDGRGGADPAGGSGLRGLADRVAALDGDLELDSPPGGGTVVRARIPCASS